MSTYRIKRALEILREEGPVELVKRCMRFINGQIYIDPLSFHCFRFRTWKNHLQNRIRYDCPPDPYEPININPKTDVNYILRRDGEGNLLIPNVQNGGLAQIKDGDWDSPQFRVSTEQALHTGNMYFVERFEQGKSVKETHRYQYLVEMYSDKKVQQEGFESVEEYVSATLKEYDDLYEYIKNNGYKTDHHGENQTPSHQPVQDRLETLVTIDRYGNINHWEGQHRKGIARVLDIEIPAHVVCRHKQWQGLRDEIHNNGLPEEHGVLRDHPDLQDVLD